jgi:hypothetical protein
MAILHAMVQVDKGFDSRSIKFSPLCNILPEMLHEPDKGIIRENTI